MPAKLQINDYQGSQIVELYKKVFTKVVNYFLRAVFFFFGVKFARKTNLF